MPVKIPTFADVGFYAPRPAGRLPQYPGDDPAAVAEGQLGKGIQAAGGAMLDIAEDQRRKANQVNAALAEADLVGNLIRTKQAIANETDPAKLDALKAQLPEHLRRAEGVITDPEVRQLWSAKARSKIVEAEALADGQHRKVWVDRFVAGTFTKADDVARLAAQSDNPADQRDAQRALGELLGSLEPYFGATKTQELVRKYSEGIIGDRADWLSANGRHTEADAFLSENGHLIDPSKLRQRRDYLKPRVDKEAGVGLLDRTAPGAQPQSSNVVERFLDLAETHESNGRNIEQQVVPPGGGYNPSVGRVTGPSTASGYFQITDTTWKEFAPAAGVDVKQFPRALAAPYKVQRDVARHIATTSGVQHWTNYNKSLRAAAQRDGLPVSGPVIGRVAPTEEELANAPVAGEPIPLDDAPRAPDWRGWMERIDAAPGYTREQKEFAKAELRQRYSEFTLGQADAASDLALAVARGEKSREDIEAAYRAGRISPEKRVELHRNFEKIDDSRRKIAEGLTRVAAAGNGGAPLDPKSKDDRDALNVHYDAVSKSWPAEQAVDRAVAYAAQYGMLPQRLQAMIRGGLRSGRPDQAVLAAETVNRLRNANPQLIADIGDEADLRLAALISAYTSAGVPAEAAARTAFESLKVGKAEREARAADFGQQRGKTAVERDKSDKEWIGKQLNSIWTIDPTVDPVMQREFEDVAKAEYERTGNLDASRQMALDTINRVWGRTRVGSELRYMKLAPEKFYGVPTLSPDENSAWMNEQLVADIGKGAFIDPATPITPERILIVPSTTTARDGRPTYIALLKDANGVFHAVTNPDGSPKTWVPDWASSAEYKRRQEGRTRKIEELRQLRASPPPFMDFLFRGGATLQEQMLRGAGETP